MDELIKNLTFENFGAEEEAQALTAVIWKHRDLFKGMGTIKNYQHKIVLKEGANHIAHQSKGDHQRKRIQKRRW